MHETEELIKQLKKQLKYLVTSSKAYDNGDNDEAIRIATTLRVLFHNGKFESLLVLLKQEKKFYFISTLESIEERRKKFLKQGLMISQNEPPIMYVNGERKPPFDSWGIKKFLPFNLWWNEKVLKINDYEYSRKDIVDIAANKDGGTHVASKINTKTKLLKKGTGRVTYGNKNSKKELTDTHLLLLRQFSYEVLSIEKLFTYNNLEFNEPKCETITYNGLLLEAEKFTNEEQYVDAKIVLNKAINYDEDRKEAYNNIGVIYEKINDVDKAIWNYTKAIKIDKNYLDAQNNLGNIYCRQKRYSLALDLYDNILFNNPNEYKAKHNRNYIYLRLKEKEEVLDQYNTFFEESKNEIYLMLMSHKLFENGEYEKALVVFQKKLHLYGDNALLLSNMGATFVKLKDYGNAKIMYMNAMKQKEIENIEVYLNILEYMLAFEQDINNDFIQKCEEFFNEKENSVIYLKMFKILFKIVKEVNIQLELEELKNEFIANNIVYDFDDLLEMADTNNLDTLKNAINFLTLA